MPDIYVTKSGWYAMGGTRLVKLTKGETREINQKEYADIIGTSWARPARSDDFDEPAASEPEPEIDVDAMEVAELEARTEEAQPLGIEPVGPEPVVRESLTADNQPDWDFAEKLAEEDDATGLKEYASGFDVKLDGRKSVAKMLEDFRAAFAE